MKRKIISEEAYERRIKKEDNLSVFVNQILAWIEDLNAKRFSPDKCISEIRSLIKELYRSGADKTFWSTLRDTIKDLSHELVFEIDYCLQKNNVFANNPVDVGFDIREDPYIAAILIHLDFFLSSYKRQKFVQVDERFKIMLRLMSRMYRHPPLSTDAEVLKKKIDKILSQIRDSIPEKLVNALGYGF